VIFVTVGTHQQPFPRLIEALASLEPADLIVQHGNSPAPEGAREAVPFLPFPDILDRMRAAQAVVSHAGVGSILLARRLGHTPVVVPRQRRYDEHVDDHQVGLTRAFAEVHLVIPVWDVNGLKAAVAGVPPLAMSRPAKATALQQAVRRALDG